jgi:hypothetical protein
MELELFHKKLGVRELENCGKITCLWCQKTPHLTSFLTVFNSVWDSDLSIFSTKNAPASKHQGAGDTEGFRGTVKVCKTHISLPQHLFIVSLLPHPLQPCTLRSFSYL